jgi:hypothetical protein
MNTVRHDTPSFARTHTNERKACQTRVEKILRSRWCDGYGDDGHHHLEEGEQSFFEVHLIIVEGPAATLEGHRVTVATDPAVVDAVPRTDAAPLGSDGCPLHGPKPCPPWSNSTMPTSRRMMPLSKRARPISKRVPVPSRAAWRRRSRPVTREVPRVPVEVNHDVVEGVRVAREMVRDAVEVQDGEAEIGDVPLPLSCFV